VVQFLEILLARNLVYLRAATAPEKGDLRENRVRRRTAKKRKGVGK
jgi:hypothetical protein